MKNYQPPPEEEAFLADHDPNRYPKPSVTMDAVVLRVRDAGLQVLLIRRGNHPYRGCWALPGGFLDLEDDETLAAGAARELSEETGLAADRLVEIGAFGRKGRDPRDRTVTVAYLHLAPEEAAVAAADDAAEAQWFDLSLGADGDARVFRGEEVPLAFDHEEVIARALVELSRRARAAAPFLELLDPSWTVARSESWLRAALRALEPRR